MFLLDLVTVKRIGTLVSSAKEEIETIKAEREAEKQKKASLLDFLESEQ
ncbi:hypothetical protein [Peribacillus frigoritolerans]|nr:hypothetical protein [Peribacillus frigoritolerans]